MRKTGRWPMLLLAAAVLSALVSLACAGNARLSVGGSIHRSSGGNWGHSLSVGIHSHGRR